MKKEISLFSVAGLTLSLLNGCMSVGPDYTVPEQEVPDAWHQVVKGELESGSPDLETWWTVFGDETLNALIKRAGENNLSLKVAVAHIEQAEAMRGVSKSQYFPSVDATGASTAKGASDSSTDYVANSAGLGMAWELDLWGRIDRSVEAADASLMATVEDYHDVMVMLYASIADNYITVRTLQERIKLAESNLAAQAETQKLTKNRFDSGLVPALDVAQAALNRSRTSSVLPTLRQQLLVAKNRLSVLVGEMPYALEQELATVKTIPAAQQIITAEVPAELLRKRPDIRRAERQLASQTALIGVQQAELYPAFSLPGTLSISSVNSANILDPVSYAFGPQLRWNIFSGGRIRNLVKAEEAATKAALHTYEQTVLLAVEEVEDSMAGYLNEKDRIVDLAAAAKSAQESVNLVSELYKSGLTDFQNVLNMEQALVTQQDAFAESRGLVSRYLVQLYAAMGGGWALPKTVAVE